MNNTRGKTLTIFVGLIVTLLVSSTCIGFFLYHQESRLRQQAESDRDNSLSLEAKLQADLKEAKRQLTILEDKNKEADEKINSLIDEVDLNEGVRKELKGENATLKESLESAKKEKDKIKEDLDEAQKKYKEVMELFKAEQERSIGLQKHLKELEEAKTQYESKLDTLKADLKPYNQRTADQQISSETIPPSSDKPKVELDKIVVNPNQGVRGKVLSFDKDAEFIVTSIGLKQGVKSGDVLSVYRGDEYLGDARVTRVQEELSAADIIPPFSSRKIRKNDIVVFKPWYYPFKKPQNCKAQ